MRHLLVQTNVTYQWKDILWYNSSEFLMLCLKRQSSMIWVNITQQKGVDGDILKHHINDRMIFPVMINIKATCKN